MHPPAQAVVGSQAPPPAGAATAFAGEPAGGRALATGPRRRHSTRADSAGFSEVESFIKYFLDTTRASTSSWRSVSTSRKNHPRAGQRPHPAPPRQPPQTAATSILGKAASRSGSTSMASWSQRPWLPAILALLVGSSSTGSWSRDCKPHIVQKLTGGGKQRRTPHRFAVADDDLHPTRSSSCLMIRLLDRHTGECLQYPHVTGCR